jgi:hypothetical protein
MDTPTENLTPADAWREIETQISTVGNYGRPQFSAPTIAEAVATIGWSVICRNRSAHRTLKRLLAQRLQQPRQVREQIQLRPVSPSPSPASTNREAQPHLFGLRGKETGIAAVAESNRGWVQRGLHAIEAMPIGTLLTGEDVAEEIGAPVNFRASGAVINLAARRGLIVRTNQLSRARDPKKCGHLNLVWRRISRAD